MDSDTKWGLNGLWEIAFSMVMVFVTKDFIVGAFAADPGGFIAFSLLMVSVGAFLGFTVKGRVDGKARAEMEGSAAQEVAALREAHAAELARLRAESEARERREREERDAEEEWNEAQAVSCFRAAPVLVKWLCAMALDDGSVTIPDNTRDYMSDEFGSAWDPWLDEETMPGNRTRFVLTGKTVGLLEAHPDLVEVARSASAEDLLEEGGASFEDVESVRAAVREAGVGGRETLLVLMAAYPDWLRMPDLSFSGLGFFPDDWMERRSVSYDVSDRRLEPWVKEALESMPEELDDARDNAEGDIQYLEETSPGVKEVVWEIAVLEDSPDGGQPGPV